MADVENSYAEDRHVPDGRAIQLDISDRPVFEAFSFYAVAVV